MATTLTGRLVMPTNFGVPSALDIAVGLGREYRFCGATTCHWTVLHHVHAMMNLAESLVTDGGPPPIEERACILLHDAHEAILRDTPTTWKTEEQRAVERKLDQRIYQCYVGAMPSLEVQHIVKGYDYLLLCAEGKLIAHPRVMYNGGMHLHYDTHGVEAAVRAVQNTRRMFDKYEDTLEVSGRLVRWYVDQLQRVCPQVLWDAYADHNKDEEREQNAW